MIVIMTKRNVFITLITRASTTCAIKIFKLPISFTTVVGSIHIIIERARGSFTRRKGRIKTRSYP